MGYARAGSSPAFGTINYFKGLAFIKPAPLLLPKAELLPFCYQKFKFWSF
jgi:hypothetical protein